MCVGTYFGSVITRFCSRDKAGYLCPHTIPADRIQAAIHPLDVAHQPADGILRNLCLKSVPWLEEDTLSRHQTLPERTDGGLPEIAALSVLLGCPSSNQRDAQVGDL